MARRFKFFIYILIYFSALIFGHQAVGQSVIPPNQCAIITGATKDPEFALDTIEKFKGIGDPLVIQSNNGFLATSIGIFDKSQADIKVAEFKAKKIIPSDSYCGNADRFIAILYPNKNFNTLLNEPEKNLQNDLENRLRYLQVREVELSNKAAQLQRVEEELNVTREQLNKKYEDLEILKSKLSVKEQNLQAKLNNRLEEFEIRDREVSEKSSKLQILETDLNLFQDELNKKSEDLQKLSTELDTKADNFQSEVENTLKKLEVRSAKLTDEATRLQALELELSKKFTEIEAHENELEINAKTSDQKDKSVTGWAKGLLNEITAGDDN
ncbi:MAG: hypothetical protein HOI86_08260 [Tateyamaria sp.]|jgi:hypothetical protein|nr:hypothetical protein [Tateyamaria sp.]MBT6267655.1 hypothetical protein [Tateyamaria sp.]MBT7446672.1 hypothetical protein [Tateyamaria sp.]MBT7801406.1 hypothetical protein [Tateyamaria sp.]MDG0982344.1 hypothetical protein [Tateyamaria sp.]